MSEGGACVCVTMSVGLLTEEATKEIGLTAMVTTATHKITNTGYLPIAWARLTSLSSSTVFAHVCQVTGCKTRSLGEL